MESLDGFHILFVVRSRGCLTDIIYKISVSCCNILTFYMDFNLLPTMGPSCLVRGPVLVGVPSTDCSRLAFCCPEGSGLVEAIN